MSVSCVVYGPLNDKQGRKIACQFGAMLSPSQAHGAFQTCGTYRYHALRSKTAVQRGQLISVSASGQSASGQPVQKNPGATAVSFDVVCPICQKTHFHLKHLDGTTICEEGMLSCRRCQRTFSTTPSSVDLTVSSGLGSMAYERTRSGGVELFRNPLISFMYERGWRDGFRWAAFPGVDKEAEVAMDLLQPAHGDVVVDMSCGSGLFSRKFLKSGKFKGVIAADFSESMLAEALQNFEKDPTIDPTQYLLLRADVARLPFATGSISAIHAGAAIHCWPDPLAAMAEISRVLRPGGVFVASTFLTATAPVEELIGQDGALRPLRPFLEAAPNVSMTNDAMRWWNVDELSDLCKAVGLQNFVANERQFRFILFSASKALV